MTSSETTFNDEELIESLRLWNRDDAADRIEQLVATNEALTKERERLEGKLEELQDRLDTANKARAHVMSLAVKRQSRAFALETKLAKAVGALDKMNVGEGWAAQKARATLAEIKGESHD